MFRSAGLAVECELASAGYRLYVSLVDTVSLHLEYFRDSPDWCRKNDLSAEATHQYVPTKLETLSPDDWAEFWSAMSDHARKSDIATRINFVLVSFLSVSLVVLLTLSTSGTMTDFLLSIFILWLVIIWIGQISVGRWLRQLPAQRTLLVRDFAARFARRVVLMEYRMMFRINWCCGTYTCHYLYLFPHTATGAVNDRVQM